MFTNTPLKVDICRIKEQKNLIYDTVMVKILRRRSSGRSWINTIRVPPLYGWRQLRHEDTPIYPPAGSGVEECLRARAASIIYIKLVVCRVPK